MAIELKYLFECDFADGTNIVQTSADVSIMESSRSEFYDVLQREKQTPITKFTLKGAGQIVSVDLVTGRFEINGLSVLLNEVLPIENPTFRLIYYRRHTHRLNVGEETKEELSHEIEYCIGWQTTIEGKNYKETLIIS